jgi:hypothetical protein
MKKAAAVAAQDLADVTKRLASETSRAVDLVSCPVKMADFIFVLTPWFLSCYPNINLFFRISYWSLV